MNCCAWKELIAFIWLPKGWPPVGTISIVFLSWCKQESNWKPNVHPAVKKTRETSPVAAYFNQSYTFQLLEIKDLTFWNKGEIFSQIEAVSATNLALCSWISQNKFIILRPRDTFNCRQVAKKYFKAQLRLLLTCSSGRLRRLMPATDKSKNTSFSKLLSNFYKGNYIKALINCKFYRDCCGVLAMKPV